MDMTEVFSYKVGVPKTDLGVSKTSVPRIGGRADGAGGREGQPVRGALPLRGPPQHAASPGMNHSVHMYV